jgi:hypothetical protein
MTPGALDLLIRARVINIKREALAGAKATETVGFHPPQIRKVCGYRPRPVLILPSNSNFTRRLMRGLVHRR